MRPDLYTKIVLTVIMLALILIGCNQYVHPAMTAQAQGAFADVQAIDTTSFSDRRTGDIWAYSGRTPDEKGMSLLIHYRLMKLGQPLAIEYSR
jgi:hypothetical protein